MLTLPRLLAALLCFSTAGAYAQSTTAFAVSGIDINDTLNLRSGPATQFEVLDTLSLNDWPWYKTLCVYVKPSVESQTSTTEDLAEWCLISDNDKRQGWVNAAYLTDTSSSVNPSVSLPLRGGFREPSDPCQQVGESTETNEYLDHSATLVACPTGSIAEQSLKQLAELEPLIELDGHTLYSVPHSRYQPAP